MLSSLYMALSFPASAPYSLAVPVALNPALAFLSLEDCMCLEYQRHCRSLTGAHPQATVCENRVQTQWCSFPYTCLLSGFYLVLSLSRVFRGLVDTFGQCLSLLSLGELVRCELFSPYKKWSPWMITFNVNGITLLPWGFSGFPRT